MITARHEASRTAAVAARTVAAGTHRIRCAAKSAARASPAPTGANLAGASMSICIAKSPKRLPMDRTIGRTRLATRHHCAVDGARMVKICLIPGWSRPLQS